MSAGNSTPELEQAAKIREQSRAATAKSQRVLACVLCQQRKVKCDRRFPCANCVRAEVRCVPANTLAPRPRRRRFPERELLDRLRHYEGLLRQNNIEFKPLHPTAGFESPSGSCGAAVDLNLDVSKDGAADKSKDAVDLWHAISRVTLDTEYDDEESDADTPEDGLYDGYDRVRNRDGVFTQAWTLRFQNDGQDQGSDHLLFGLPKTDVDLSACHPEQAQIFRLWQIYLDNVNPLLKVTHTPTLQPRIIDAASDVMNISPALEALIFSIYSVSIVSLSDGDCLMLFKSSRKHLLAHYQSACQQALLKCNAWRFGEGDDDGLTALYLYLVSVRPQTDPRSLSCMLSVAIRIAQRMGLHRESTYAGCTALEAEMRRRLWWSLVLFDHRICELSDYKVTSLAPTWNCNVPLNINDFEIRTEMKNSPKVHEGPSEAIFAVVRSELADSLRHSAFHLKFVNPSLGSISQHKDVPQSQSQESSELLAPEKLIEENYLSICDPENPLHFMTIWTTRASIARSRLLEHYSRHSESSTHITEEQRSAGLSYAMKMLECDTKIRTSPLTKGYLWLVDYYFPALAYLHILNGLSKRPAEAHGEEAWAAMNNNYAALATRQQQQSGDEQGGAYVLSVTFSTVILQAWEAREEFLKEHNKPLEPVPWIVSDVKEKVTQKSTNCTSKAIHAEKSNTTAEEANNNSTFMMPSMVMDFGGFDSTEGNGFLDLDPAGYYPDFLGQPVTEADTGQDWAQMDWRWLNTQR